MRAAHRLGAASEIQIAQALHAQFRLQNRSQLRVHACMLVRVLVRVSARARSHVHASLRASSCSCRDSSAGVLRVPDSGQLMRILIRSLLRRRICMRTLSV